jgi:hypothetical protein
MYGMKMQNKSHWGGKISVYLFVSFIPFQQNTFRLEKGKLKVLFYNICRSMTDTYSMVYWHFVCEVHLNILTS